MKLLHALKDQLSSLGALRRVWLTSFNINTDFIETYLLPAILGMDPPRNRMDYESFQMVLIQKEIDLRIFCDKRALEADQYKRTTVAIHPVSLRGFAEFEGKTEESLFHPKVIFLEDVNGKMILGAGSANLTVSGWGRNQEVFSFHVLSNDNQYQQVKSFFTKLGEGIGLRLDLGVRRKFGGNDTNWRFVHSFQKKTFVNQFFNGGEIKQLSVWSPYLSENLPRLLESIRDTSANPHLKFLVVPDRIEGRYIRTPWSDALSDSIQMGDITFCTAPGKRPDNIEMTHAKIWLASGSGICRLAIGSWNFTHSGSSSFESRNVEAGILIDCDKTEKITGEAIPVTASDFASRETLQDEKLDLPLELPFDLQVAYDWHKGAYSIEGSLFRKDQETLYLIRLPGVGKAVALAWRKNRKQNVWPLESIELVVPDNEPLLSDHSYAIERKGELVYRGLILELGQSFRRALGYDSLQDLLDGLINHNDPTTTDNIRLRDTLRTGGGPDEDLPLPPSRHDIDSLSYFRLFYAMEQFRLKLQAAKSSEEMEKWLFVYPGCVQELAAKTRQQIEDEPGKIFNWFLAQEVNSLYEVSLQRYEYFREAYAPKQPPQQKWSTLKVKLPALPAEIAQHKKYLHDIKQECGYANS